MQIHGLQKMTLLDFPGRVACTVFLGGCDFRCPFCHNFELVDGTAGPQMDDVALQDFLRRRRGLLDGVAITGGEPCLRKDLPELMESIRDMGFSVKLDTNGAHPGMLRTLLQRDLVQYVAMDIKNCPTKYASTCGLETLDLQPIRESVQLLMASRIDYEFRTTVVREMHEKPDFEEIAAWIRGARRYALQAFTDRDTVPFAGLHAPDREEMESYAAVVRPHVGEVLIRGIS